MAKTAAILQSNYIPWKGYFDIIHDVDTFVFYDDVQYTSFDWRNRNIIKTPGGPLWLTIPVGTSRHRRICDVEIPATGWAARHIRSLRHHYGRAPHFRRYEAFLEDVYLGRTWHSLSDLNQHIIKTVASEFLGIRTEFHDSREFEATAKKADRLLEVLDRLGAGVYVSGPAAKDYISEQQFEDAGIELVWKDYEGYPEYPQLHPPFSHKVTILDLLFHVGPEAPSFIWGWRDQASQRSA